MKITWKAVRGFEEFVYTTENGWIISKPHRLSIRLWVEDAQGRHEVAFRDLSGKWYVFIAQCMVATRPAAIAVWRMSR